MIVDPNDSDGDGVPDFLEASSTGPGQLRLEIVKTPSGVQLIIHGEVGRTYILEDIFSLPAGQWEHPLNIWMTATPHVIELAAPSAPTFWRVRVP
jgi:hypothetical protein